MDQGSVAELFDLAIGLENAASSLYEALAKMFSHDEEVAAFWTTYANEEVMHARGLEKLKEKLSPETLAEEMNGEMLQIAKNTFNISPEALAQRIENLDDAYELVNELEAGETNAIFDFLIDNYEVGQKSRQFLKMQLKQHVTKVATGFPERYQNRASRRALKALK